MEKKKEVKDDFCFYQELIRKKKKGKEILLSVHLKITNDQSVGY